MKFHDDVTRAIRATFPNTPVITRLFSTNEGDRPLNETDWRELVDTRHELSAAIRKVLDLPAIEKRQQTEAEVAAVDALQAVVDRYKHEMDWRDQIGDRNPRNLKSGRGLIEQQTQHAQASGICFRDLATGRIVRSARPGESLHSVREGVPRPKGRFGDLVASIYRGRPTTPELAEDWENRTMSIGSLTAGGYAVPEPFSMQFIDLARAKMVALMAGASTIVMEGNTLVLARIDADPTAAWKSENNAWTASEATLGQMALTARTVGCLVKLSEELMQDSPNIGQILETSIVGAMALEMDRVALVGSGVAPEPGGIMKSGTTANTNVQTLVVGGTPTSYGFFSRMVQKVREANHEPTAAVWHPRDLGTLDRLVDTTGQTIAPPKSFTDIRHYSTTQIPDDLESGASPNDASIVIVGKWDELVIAPRLRIDFLFSRESNDGTDSATAKYQIHIRAVARMDIGITRGAAFCVGTGVND